MKLIILILLFTRVVWGQDYFQQDVHYTIEVTLDVNTRTYLGKQILTYKNNAPTSLDSIWIHLYPNAYKDESTPFARQEARLGKRSFHFSTEQERGYLEIDSILSKGRHLTWETKADAIDEIRLALPESLLPGDSCTLTFYFRGKFPKVFSRMGNFDESLFAATQWYPKVVVYDRFGWHPDSYLDMGEFYGEYGNYDVSITLPAHYIIDATGMLQDNPQEEAFNQAVIDSTSKLLAMPRAKDRKQFTRRWLESRKKLQSDQMKTVRFVTENVHDFAWFCGDRYMLFRTIHNGGILSNVLVLPQNVWNWRHVPQYIERTIRFFSEQIGPYQYPKASVVDGSTVGSGMEYPMITIISSEGGEWHNLLEVVVMHELGHNWFYGMLGNNERRDTFLDEGINSFYEYKYMLAHYGFNNLTRFRNLPFGLNWIEDIGEWHLVQFSHGLTGSQNTGQPLKLRAEEFAPGNYGMINYHKGVSLMLALEWLLGEDTFRRGIQTYYQRWNGKHPTHEDFFSIMEEVYGQSLNWFVEAWYNQTTYNDFKITRKKTVRRDDHYETTVFLKNKGTMSGMPAPVHLVTTTHDTLEARWSGQSADPVVIVHNDPPKRVEVNLRRSIFESNYLNNSNRPKIDFNFIGQIPRFDTYAVNFLPYYWYEYFGDKNRVGLGFWSGNPFFNYYFSHGSFYYGTASRQIGYDFNLSNRYHSFFSNYLDAGFAIKDMDGLNRFSLELQSAHLKASDERYAYFFNLTFDHINLYDRVYNEPTIFEKARYTTATLSFSNRFNRMLYSLNSRLAIERSLDLLDNEADYTKATFSFNYKRYLTRKSHLRFDLFGSAIAGDKVPAQELIYAGGETDPKHKRFAIGRRGSVAPLRHFIYNEGMNMPGYTASNHPLNRGKAGASARLTYKYGFLPSFYGSVATISASAEQLGKDIFGEYGLIIGGDNINIILPLYVTDPAPGEKHWAWRYFFSFRTGLALIVGG